MDGVAIQDVDTVEDVQKANSGALILTLLLTVTAPAVGSAGLANIIFRTTVASLDGSVARFKTQDNSDGHLHCVAVEDVDAVENVQQTNGGAGVFVAILAITTARPTVSLAADVILATGLEVSAASLEAEDDIDWDLNSVAVEHVDTVEDVQEANSGADIFVLITAVAATRPAAAVVAALDLAAIGASLEGKAKSTDDDVDGNLNSVAVKNVDAVKNVHETN